MRILFLTQGVTIPSARFRVGQFVEHFRNAGIEVAVRAAYDERYNDVANRGGLRAAAYKLLARTRRAAHTAGAGAFDIVFVQRPTFPFTAAPERLLGRLHPAVIFDVDDAIFLDSAGEIMSSRYAVFQQCASAANAVIAGNSFLQNQIVGQSNIRVIPTVIDTDRYKPTTREVTDTPFVVGWMGTAGNFPFLSTIEPELRAFLSAHPQAKFRIVSNAEFVSLAEHPQVEQIRWTADSEISQLQSFDVGLMPLHDTPHARGKCAFKMIQYMAVGIPYVASPVGANVEVHGAGDGGILAGVGHWENALNTLIADSSKRAAMGTSARARCEERYSIRAVLPQYLELFEEMAGRAP